MRDLDLDDLELDLDSLLKDVSSGISTLTDTSKLPCDPDLEPEPDLDLLLAFLLDLRSGEDEGERDLDLDRDLDGERDPCLEWSLWDGDVDLERDRERDSILRLLFWSLSSSLFPENVRRQYQLLIQILIILWSQIYITCLQTPFLTF